MRSSKIQRGQGRIMQTLTSLVHLLVTVFMLFLPSQSAAMREMEAAGDLDTAFGVGGKVTTDFFGNPSFADAIVIQADGKIVAAGGTVRASSNVDFALSRYNADGSLDGTFSSTGKTTTDFFGYRDQAYSVGIQADGKIVAAGRAQTGSSYKTSDFALARYNMDGSLDAGFGSSGLVTTDFFGDEDLVTSLSIQMDGKIVAVGFANGPTTRFALARYNSDGSLDGSFGSGGKVTTNAGTVALAIQSDHKIVTAGGTTNFELARYNTDGSLDSGFGVGGKVADNFFGPPDSANAIVIQPDGKIVAAGLVRGSPNPFENFGLARYNADGSLDRGFGESGVASTDFGDDGIKSIAIQSDGKIVAVGSSLGMARFAMARYNSDGSIDTSFGFAGKVTTSFGTGSAARAVAIQADDKIVVSGLAGAYDFALARYLSGAATQPDFALFFEPDVVGAQPGTKTRITVKINRTGGFTGSVTVTPPDPAMGIKPKPAGPITTSDNSASFKLKIRPSVTDTHLLTFTGRDDSGRVRTATLTLIIQ
ncbi:MAG TPA: delta-60 repeat domain-containing protein [Blastocatellia bacterium]|nr:delta-60 repeat domain-containing protein [Blastocatellia bacterium]